MTEAVAAQGVKDPVAAAGGSADAGAAAAAAAASAAVAAGGAGGADKGAAAGDKGAAAATIIGAKDGGAAADDKTKVVAPADWPTDWRDKLAEQLKPGDKAFRTRLDRLASVADVGKSWLSLEQRLSAGEIKAVTPFPEKGTDAEKASWRTEQGVPATPADYKIELKGGMVVGEADKPVVDEFTKWAHANNKTPADVNATLQWYYELQDKQSQQAAVLDAEHRQKSEDTLRTELGADYRRTVNAVDNFLSAWPEPLVKSLQGARGADGALLFDNPAFVKALAATALELNPAATLVPTGGGGAQGVATRLAEIRKVRQDTPDKYDNDKAMQAEELTLIDAQLKLQARGKAA